VSNPKDTEFMARAVELSARGFPAPNPHVGCVLVKNHKIIGEGFHNRAGGPHAEIEAIQSAIEDPRGATAYVTLEPCNHHGKTPPCSAALVKAGISRVVFSVPDPNPAAVGGKQALEKVGIVVESGLLERESTQINRRFLLAMRLSRPWITVKAAITQDGKIARKNGESKWITNESSRNDVQRLRAEHAAILIGRKTAQIDLARLTVRKPGFDVSPVRCVIDFNDEAEPTLPVFDSSAPSYRFVATPSRSQDLQAADLDSVLNHLFRLGLTSVLVEGGARTYQEFLARDLVDELVLYVSPKTFGEGIDWWTDCSNRATPLPNRFTIVSETEFAGDFRRVYRPIKVF
jgi:diaminohydroxyphosphoribosylaminopyrimidine deaminase/5-amino-6-(5-phosphoribosylamino)uracil reductase